MLSGRHLFSCLAAGYHFEFRGGAWLRCLVYQEARDIRPILSRQGGPGPHLEVKRPALLRQLTNDIVIADDSLPIAIEVPVSFARRGVETRLIVDGPSGEGADRAPDPALIKAVARAHVWLEELTSGRARSIVEIAQRESVSDRFVSIL